MTEWSVESPIYFYSTLNYDDCRNCTYQFNAELPEKDCHMDDLQIINIYDSISDVMPNTIRNDMDE